MPSTWSLDDAWWVATWSAPDQSAHFIPLVMGIVLSIDTSPKSVHCNKSSTSLAIIGEEIYILTAISVGFPDGSASQESACSAGDTGDTVLIPGLRRSPGGENGNPFQCSCLKNLMDRETWQATVQRVMKSGTWLSTHVGRAVYAQSPCGLACHQQETQENWASADGSQTERQRA